MVIDLSSCTAFGSKAYFIFFCVLIITTIISGAFVYKNEKKMKGREALLNEIFAGVSVFFTGNFLNDKGKKWRPIYVFSFIGLVVLTLMGIFLDIC